MFLSLRLRLERRGRPYLSRADSCLTGPVSYLSGWSEHEIFRAAVVSATVRYGTKVAKYRKSASAGALELAEFAAADELD